jgi:hypothetical protein
MGKSDLIFIISHFFLCSILLSACAVYVPSKKFDIENEKRITELSTKRDFVSPEERDVIDSELSIRNIKRDGLVIPDPLFVHTKGSDNRVDKPKPLDDKDKLFNQLLEKQLGGQSNINERLLKLPPAN